jgi:hypothetical protein
LQADSIFSFSSDPSTVNFAHYFLEQGEGSVAGPGELQVMHFLTTIVYECVTHDKLSMIPVWITIIKVRHIHHTHICTLNAITMVVEVNYTVLFNIKNKIFL